MVMRSIRRPTFASRVMMSSLGGIEGGSRTRPVIAILAHSPAPSTQFTAQSRSKRAGTSERSEPKGRMRFRIGVNGDIFGDGVNVAARLEGMVLHDHLHHRSDNALWIILVVDSCRWPISERFSMIGRS
jgi:hypothetical protein